MERMFCVLFQGRIPIHTGLQHGVIEPSTPYGLPLNLTLLPQQLKKNGYSTHMIGKQGKANYDKEGTSQTQLNSL